MTAQNVEDVLLYIKRLIICIGQSCQLDGGMFEILPFVHNWQWVKSLILQADEAHLQDAKGSQTSETNNENLQDTNASCTNSTGSLWHKASSFTGEFVVNFLNFEYSSKFL